MDTRGPEAREPEAREPRNREPRNKLILFCDGTWFAMEAGTETNIHLLAEMVGINMGSELSIRNTDTVKARYYANGVGLGSTFMHYILDGATGSSIQEECTNAYQYIVENYTPQFEIWMFGLSRGAYIIRSVAGMINNCGIIKPTLDKDGNIDPLITTMRCDRVYETYRLPAEWAHPQSGEMIEFRNRNSHDVKTPVKFMGLFDTVGSLGTPMPTVYRRSGGEGVATSEASYDNNVLGFASHSFYDTRISSVVEKVYHALSLHDRFYMFPPCLVNQSIGYRSGYRRDPKFEIHQKWFPGTHYDLCRQEFKLFRVGTSFPETVAAMPLNTFSSTIRPNTVLSDLVLKWMLESIQREDPDHLVIPDIDEKIREVVGRIRRGENVGSGDVYDDLLQYLPFGHVIHSAYSLWSYISCRFLPRRITEPVEAFFGINFIKLIVVCKERLVTELKADVYHYEMPDLSLGGLCIGDLAKVSGDRYPSKAYEKFLVNQLDMGLIEKEDFAARWGTKGGD
ncbi:hypothetical protein V2G26_012042 [Clonostachys chloroleuca]